MGTSSNKTTLSIWWITVHHHVSHQWWMCTAAPGVLGSTVLREMRSLILMLFWAEVPEGWPCRCRLELERGPVWDHIIVTWGDTDGKRWALKAFSLCWCSVLEGRRSQRTSYLDNWKTKHIKLLIEVNEIYVQKRSAWLLIIVCKWK